MSLSRRALLTSSACAAGAMLAEPALAKHARHAAHASAPHGSAAAQLNAFLKDALEAHEEALEGPKYGYGDDLVLSAQWGENNSPYAVSQMTGAFQTLPDFLDSIHPIETKNNTDTNLKHIEGFARQLDQESVRLVADAGR